ncbi:MAG: MarR family winged helix-turn-helix transcriptional regulator [Methylorubrum populi]
MKDTTTAPRLRTLPTRMLGQVAALTGQHTIDALAEAGANRHQFSVLATLDAFGSLTQAELCRRTGIDRSDMNAALNALEGRKIVGRSVDPASRRQNIVSLHADGRDYFRDLDERIEMAQEAAMKPLSPDERTELGKLLGKLYDHHTMVDRPEK